MQNGVYVVVLNEEILRLKLIAVDGCLTVNFIVLWGFKGLNYVLMV
jgi:hypothetical protein